MAVFVFVRLEKTKCSYHVHADSLKEAVTKFNDDGGELKSDEREEVLDQWVYDEDGHDATDQAAEFDEEYWEAQQ